MIKKKIYMCASLNIAILSGKLEKNQGEGTVLKLKDKDEEGPEVDNKKVLEGAEIYVEGRVLNENDTLRIRSSTVSSVEPNKTIKVYQSGGAILVLNQTTYNLPGEATTISVQLKSNIDYSVSVSDEWIKEVSTRAISSL